MYNRINIIHVYIFVHCHHHITFSVYLQDGDCPLHKASWAGKAEVVNILLSSGADVNIRNKVCITNLYLNMKAVQSRGMYKKLILYIYSCIAIIILHSLSIYRMVTVLYTKLHGPVKQKL